MLQFFPSKSYTATFSRGTRPRLEYVCNVGPESSWMPRSMHEHETLAEILFLYEGAGIYRIDGKRYTAQKGDLILYNSHTVHDEFGGSGTKLSSYCVAVSELSIPALPRNHIVPKSLSPIQPTGNLFSSFLHLFSLIEAEAKAHAETAHYLAMALICKVAALLKESGVPCMERVPTLATRALSFIDKNYKEPIRLGDIAKAVNANPYYFAHQFKEEIGLSPMRYVVLRRIGEAQNLLINTQKTITQIATQVGYNNSNYFQNVFKGALGMTPREYRLKWTV